MTHGAKHAPRRSAMPVTAATLAVLTLAGCTSGHVGESWQCPLAKGGSCDSVAAADPAVPDRQAAGRTVPAEPLYRVRADGRSKAPAETPCEADCGSGFDPFGWLMRLFGADGKEEARPSAETAPAPATAVRRESGSGPAEPAAAALPDAPAPAGDDVSGDDLRTGEVVARIWIAPFVDANGVYREAAHVRVVLEPAGWRLK